MLPIKEALKSLLALILLAGFFELLLPDDKMRKYGRMVIGLIVLFSLVNLMVQVGRGFSGGLPLVEESGRWADVEGLVAEGLNLRRRGEEQAAATTTPVVQAKIEQFLRSITGTEEIKLEIDGAAVGQTRRVRVVLTADPGVSVEFLKRMVAELLTVNPEQVEVEQKFEGE